MSRVYINLVWCFQIIIILYVILFLTIISQYQSRFHFTISTGTHIQSYQNLGQKLKNIGKKTSRCQFYNFAFYFKKQSMNVQLYLSLDYLEIIFICIFTSTRQISLQDVVYISESDQGIIKICITYQGDLNSEMQANRKIHPGYTCSLRVIITN